MRLVFLGCSSAFAVGDGHFHSNMAIGNTHDRLLIDCGGDIRHSMYAEGLSYDNIDGVFITHLHADHVQGLEWLGINRYFDKEKPIPKLYIRDTLVEDLWEHVLKGTMRTLRNVEPKLSTYFDVHILKESEGFEWGGVSFELIDVVHYYSNGKVAPTYGLIMTTDRQKTLLTSDTQFTPDLFEKHYNSADLIFHDCETVEERSSVHAHYDDLQGLSPEVKKKMWLYHYNDGPLPDAQKDGFAGFVSRGQTFEI